MMHFAKRMAGGARIFKWKCQSAPFFLGLTFSIACLYASCTNELHANERQATGALLVELSAGGHDRLNCPFTLRLPNDWTKEQEEKKGELALVSDSGQSTIPLQYASRREVVGIVSQRLKAGEVARYWLRPTNRDVADRVVSENDGKRLTIKLDQSVVCRFNHGYIEAPETLEAVYGRSGYIHPVMTPSGQEVTGDFQPDHPHQHGIFMAWVNATYEGRPVDFWNQAKQTGGVRFRRFRRNFRPGPVFGEFTAELDYFVRLPETDKSKATEQAILRDRWNVRVYATNHDHFLIELRLSQRALDRPITVNEYHYGGFAMRGPGEWLLRGDEASEATSDNDPIARGDFLTSAHRTRADGNHSRARWVEMHGPRGAQHAGLIALASTANFRGPQTVRLHGSKPYFCFAPMVNGSFTISKDRPYTSQFRLAPHDGAVAPELAERLWQDLAHPLQARIIAPERPVSPKQD